MKRLLQVCTLSLLSATLLSSAHAENFKALVGDAKAAPLKKQDVYNVPYLTWGGDVAAFYANGAEDTQKGSIFDSMGVKVRCVNGDNFPKQVKAYMAGETPYLRGTVRMIAMASEVLNSDPSTKPVMVAQLTWSAGDHMVARKTVSSLNDLKGKKVALQQGGPHVGMLDDILRSARLKWSDITVIWCKNLTGAGSPDEKFREDPSVDACLVISPDMVNLCGGLDATGNGNGGTIKDSRVAVSTAQMSRSIADVYCVRKDYYDSNKADVEKFVTGIMKASEVLAAGNSAYNSGKMGDEYKKGLKLAQEFFGKDILPTLEVDAHGLLSDCSFVGLPGNASFFTDAGNLSGFAKKTEQALAMAKELKYGANPGMIMKADFNYEALGKSGSLKAAPAAGKKIERFVDIDADILFPKKKEEAKKTTIVSFKVLFEAEQSDFPESKYADQFERAIEAASTFGNAAVAIGGHADITLLLRQAVVAGAKKGVLKREKTAAGTKYFVDGKEIDLEDTAGMMELIESGKFAGTDQVDPATMLKQLNKLSMERAESVRKAIVAYAKKKGYTFDASQLKAVGIGPRDPAVARPRSAEEAAQNRRVEFRLVSVPTEKIKKGDFDF